MPAQRVSEGIGDRAGRLVRARRGGPTQGYERRLAAQCITPVHTRPMGTATSSVSATTTIAQVSATSAAKNSRSPIPPASGTVSVWKTTTLATNPTSTRSNVRSAYAAQRSSARLATRRPYRQPRSGTRTRPAVAVITIPVAADTDATTKTTANVRSAASSARANKVPTRRGSHDQDRTVTRNPGSRTRAS